MTSGAPRSAPLAVAVQRPIRHLEEIEHGRIRTAAIHNVAGVDSEAALAHGDHQIAQTAERFADDGYASQQGLMRKQGSSAIGGVSN